MVAFSAQIADSAPVLRHDDDAGSGGNAAVGRGLANDAGGLVPQVSPPRVPFLVLMEFGADGNNFDVDQGVVAGGPGFGDFVEFAGARADRPLKPQFQTVPMEILNYSRATRRSLYRSSRLLSSMTTFKSVCTTRCSLQWQLRALATQ